MHSTTTAISTTPRLAPPRRNPDHLLADLARSRLAEAEWRVVRTGLAIMALIAWPPKISDLRAGVFHGGVVGENKSVTPPAAVISFSPSSSFPLPRLATWPACC